MQYIRLINSLKWHQEGNRLLLFLWTQKITLPNNLGLAELFYEMLVSDKNFTREMLIDQYHISEKVIDFLIQLSVFIVVGNGAGPEARMFHSLVENPSLLYLPEQQDDTFIASLYHHLEDFFEDSLGKAIDGYRFYGVQQQKFTITLQPTTSTRKSEGEVKDSCQQEILEMISSFCSSYHDAHYYGSWGGLYSLYPVLIFRNNEVFIFDRYKECFYKYYVDLIYREVSSTFISTEWNCFDQYECYVVFLSAYEATLLKYSNRGYKYIQMEAGALATLIRQYCASRTIPQLEVQGYFDQLLMEVLVKKLGINQDKTLLIHTMCLN